jgi:hypothetical protein
MKNLDILSIKLVQSSDLIKLIDIKDNKDCWFQCLHSYSVFYKTPIQIINNQFIIEKLMPLDASMIGLICGEVYTNYLKNGEVSISTINQNSTSNEFHYQLLFINRDGSIEYQINNLERFCEKNILDLVRKKEVMKKFSSFDAYYIGFLAGLELYKMKNNLNSNKKRKPILRLVKF